MPYEVKPWNKWKKEGCVLTLKTSDISSRETYSREINKEYGEGGGLNANYQTVEAVAIIANALGAVNGFRYGEQFIFKTTGLDEVILEFNEPENRRAGEATIQAAFKSGALPLDIRAEAKACAAA